MVIWTHLKLRLHKKSKKRANQLAYTSILHISLVLLFFNKAIHFPNNMLPFEFCSDDRSIIKWRDENFKNHISSLARNQEMALLVDIELVSSPLPLPCQRQVPKYFHQVIFQDLRKFLLIKLSTQGKTLSILFLKVIFYLIQILQQSSHIIIQTRTPSQLKDPL